jgi:hypothetical protein
MIASSSLLTQSCLLQFPHTIVRTDTLNLEWSKNGGVTGTMVNPSGNRFAQVQTINLKATEPLRQYFDLWDSFGLTGVDYHVT